MNQSTYDSSNKKTKAYRALIKPRTTHPQHTGPGRLDQWLSIVIPAKNEAENLERPLPILKKSYPNAEIIVVNDGSTDKTKMSLEKVRHKSNKSRI